MTRQEDCTRSRSSSLTHTAPGRFRARHILTKAEEGCECQGSYSLMEISREDSLRNRLCNATLLEFNSVADRDIFQNISCSLTPRQLRQTRDAFQQNIPRALDLNPVETLGLVEKTAEDATPVFEQISRLRYSLLSDAAQSLDFKSDMVPPARLRYAEAEDVTT
ncbi:hypothetical protein JZ751_005830 [Albula glossodonta]|uniref:Uncharacterized protein n=1 Tax=Albula glossodonta TaxID=121402 RepID=A0A8T2P0J0_9TELE|nr:hypothetical protein JZ751_005830 [Albula glossodonta]